MTEKSLASALLALPNERAWQQFLEKHRNEISTQIVTDLEQQANRLRLEDPNQALHAADAMIHIAEFLGDERARANGLRVKGNLLLYRGRCQESIALYRKAREIRARYRQELEIARLQVGWTWALKDLARYEEALELGMATRELLMKYKKWEWLANLELNIGYTYWLTDRYAEALTTCEQSQKHFSRAGNPVGAAQAQVNMARSMVCQDRFREAMALLEEARAVFEVHSAWVPLARTDLNLATLSFRLGRYRRAWELYEQARQAFVQQDNEMEVAVVDLYCSHVYLRLNLFPEALRLAQNARPVFARLEMVRYVALADFNQAMAYLGLGEREKALALFQRARAFFATHQGDTLTARIDLERAALLRDMGRSTVALAMATQAAMTFVQHGVHVRWAQAQLLRAECHLDLDQVDKASSLYQASLEDIPYVRELPTLIYRAQYGLGRAAEAKDQLDAALDHYRAAIKAVEALRHSLRVDEFKAGFLDDKLALYEDAVRLSLKMGYLEEAFSYVERAKSSALLDLLARNLELQTERGLKMDPQIWERLKTLKEEWLWHHSKLEGPPVEDSEEKWRGGSGEEQAWSGLRRVEAQIRQVLRQLQRHPLYALTRDDAVGTSWQVVRGYLEQDALLIEYFCIDDEILAFLISADGLKVCRTFPYSLREVERSLGALNLTFRGLADLEADYVQEVLNPLARRHLTWLYEALIAPLGDLDADYRQLVIVPHDALYYLPFHAFYDGQQYLIERFAIQYAPSTSVLAHCYQIQEAIKDVDRVRPALVMGYSDEGRLRHVLDEVQAVAKVLPSSHLFQEETATLKQLHQDAGRCRLVHLAAHAVFRSDNPLFSTIKLADGPLNVIDIYHLRLRASLVALSGCETGKNQLKGGELFGLARGCLYAGAPKLVASLWQVDDASTAILMRAFYQYLEEGATTANALRKAQLSLLQTPHEHPHYWAPFFLMGADGVV
jgi:tetratricopeptide (TPR) repeat protein